MRVIGMEASHGDAVLTFACAATIGEDGTRYNAILGWKVSQEDWDEYVQDGLVSVIPDSPEIPGGPCDGPHMVMRVKTDSVPGALLHVTMAHRKKNDGLPSWSGGPWTYYLFMSVEDIHDETIHLARPLLAWSKMVGSEDSRKASMVLDHKLVASEILGIEE